jgi:hypothetical protein
MAVGHFGFNHSSTRGAALASALERLEQARDDLVQEVGTFVQMQDGGALTAYAVAQYGFAGTTEATAALAELESMAGALAGIKATLDQGFNKLR